MVLAEWLEDAFERRDRRRQVERAWKEWRTRLEKAREQGRPFTEPPPVAPRVGRSTTSPIRVRYNRETDTLTIVLRDDPVAVSTEPAAGLILDLDGEREVVAIEILEASRRTNLQVSTDLG